MQSKALWGLAALLVACSSSSASDAGTNNGGCAPIATPEPGPPVPPDGAMACPSGACNYEAQDGCPATQACRPQFNATDPVVNPGCESVGSGVSQSACTLQSDCARGYYCVEQQCHRLCCGNDWSVCADGESCIKDLSVRAGGQVMPSGAGLCYPLPAGSCDPLTPGSCATGECEIIDSRGSVACGAAGQAREGESCAGTNFCAAGLICVEVDVGGVPSPLCRKLCRAESCGTPACTADEGTCKHFARDPAGVGECTPGL